MGDRVVDILIIGGGLTGASLMLALADLGYSTLLVEATPFSNRIQADFDARSLALAPASVRILEMLKLMPLLQAAATPIKTIHISERQCFGSTKLSGDKDEPLGYVLEMQHINSALYQLLDKQQTMAPAELMALDYINTEATIRHAGSDIRIKARLIIAADGVASSVRRLCGLTPNIKTYEQIALVANIGLARAHQYQAYERFTPSGPLALLPMSGLRASLVWSLSPKQAEQLLISSEQDFLKALQETFGYRLGRFVKVGKRSLYPLQQVIMPQQVLDSVVFIGNAAHTLHPVAGQGFNLGLRDVAILAQCIAHEGLSHEMLQHYQQARQHDQTAIARFTDGLIELFASGMLGLSTARGAGLIVLDNVGFLKNILARYARGFAGVVPDLVCGIPLKREGFS